MGAERKVEAGIALLEDPGHGRGSRRLHFGSSLTENVEGWLALDPSPLVRISGIIDFLPHI